MSSLNDFLREVKELQKANLYRVTISFPDFISDRTKAGKQVEFLVKNTQLPGATLGETEVPFKNKKIYMAGDITFEPWEGTALLSEDFTLRDAMLEWMEKTQDFEKTDGLNNLNDYTAPIQIEALSKDGKVNKKVTLYYAWIQSVSPIDMSYESTDTIAEYTFTVRYSYFK